MQHRIKFKNLEEKIEIWLDLCEFCFELIKDNVSAPELKKDSKRLERLTLKRTI